MDESTDRFRSFGRRIDSCLGQGAYREALAALREFEAVFPSDHNLRFNKNGILIDIGLGLRDPAIVQEGVDSGERLLRGKLPKRFRASVLYNLANGYSHLYKLTERGQFTTIPQSDNLQKSKQLNREALQLVDDEDGEQRVKILVNLANSYDALGRGVEAIQVYDDVLLLAPAFSMAIANRAKALKYFADISGENRASIYIEAYQAIRSVLNNQDLVGIGGFEAKTGFAAALKDIESRFENPDVLNSTIVYPQYSDRRLSKFEKFYLAYSTQEKLFLNFHLHHPRSKAAIVDSVLFTMITGLNENQRFFALAKRINQIKEDYATARLLLVQSRYRRADFDKISRRTVYVDSLDYSRFDVYIGLLKAAFQLGYNILDKIACFLNEYCQLGFETSEVAFHKIWREDGNSRDTLLRTGNINLYALYDIFKDFKSGYHEGLRQIRHALTHRKLVVRDLVPADRPLEPAEEMPYEKLMQQTTELLRLLRAAIIYLINFVNGEERKKGEDGRLTIPFPVFTM
jgi:hypothetical protein